MLYELLAIARVANPLEHAKEAKEVATTIGKLIVNNRGVIRKIQSMGVEQLPKVISKDQERHFQGHRFLMLFDSSSAVQTELLRTVKADPRVIRSLIVKVEEDKSLVNGTSIDNSYSRP